MGHFGKGVDCSLKWECMCRRATVGSTIPYGTTDLQCTEALQPKGTAEVWTPLHGVTSLLAFMKKRPKYFVATTEAATARRVSAAQKCMRETREWTVLLRLEHLFKFILLEKDV